MAGELDAVRLIFAHGPPPQAGDPFIVLVEHTPIQKRVISSPDIPALTTGPFVEIQDADGVCLFRALVPQLFAATRHLHRDPVAGDQITREIDEIEEDLVVTVVPVLDGAAEIVLRASPAVLAPPVAQIAGMATTSAVQDIARFDWPQLAYV